MAKDTPEPKDLPTPKTEEELKKEQEQAKRAREAFLKDYDDMTKNLAVKHGLQLVPVLNATQQGIMPMFDVIKVNVENEKTNTPTD